MPRANSKQTVSTGPYATAADFKRIFTEDINSLYLLSLLLTGNHENAEKCFVEGIGESTNGNHIFKEWARSWARRTIIQSAIRLLNPREGSATTKRTAEGGVGDKVPTVLHPEVGAILELASLERLVFVMSVLERYSDNDCSILLGCARRDVVATRARAMQQLAMLLGLKHNSPADAGAETSIELIIAEHFATPAWTAGLSR